VCLELLAEAVRVEMSLMSDFKRNQDGQRQTGKAYFKKDPRRMGLAREEVKAAALNREE